MTYKRAYKIVASYLSDTNRPEHVDIDMVISHLLCFGDISIESARVMATHVVLQIAADSLKA